MLSLALPTSIQQFVDELDAALELLRTSVQSVTSRFPKRSLQAHQAEWHAKGVAHHTKQVINNYAEFAHGVVTRANIEAAPNAIFMPATLFQEMMFEFYAALSLARITLDNLRMFLRPVFATDFGQIPKSINDIMENMTDCPIYTALSQIEDCSYLIDLRNCLVHHRTFATSDQAMVTEDGYKDQVAEPITEHPWFDSFARASFRRQDDRVIVNVYLPDAIFERNGNGKKLAQFTYANRINLLSQAMNFARLTIESVTGSCILLAEIDGPRYTYSKLKKN